MRNNTYVIIGIALFGILGIGGYVGYQYIKEKPPTAFIKLVTKRTPPPPLPEGDRAPLVVPPGFVATIYAREVPGARVMTRDQRGTLLLSLTKEGKVLALPDENADRKADRTVTILQNLKQPHGILVHCSDPSLSTSTTSDCTLYIAETNALKSYVYDAETFTATGGKTLMTLPSGDGHFTRTLLLHPDGKRLLISVGSSCNVCIEDDPKRAAIVAFDIATGQSSLFAKGLRNTVFMAIHPVTGEVWGTDNGRDLIGDDIPPDELNILREGKNYGWPFCYGKNIHDTDFRAENNPCSERESSFIDLPAHSAALGLAFIPEEGWPEEFWHHALVAFHGSWNRSTPTGYKIVRIPLDDQGKPEGPPVDFITGFIPEGAKEEDAALGRPVDILVEPGGNFYVSDDRAGAVYRISRSREE